MERTRAAGGGGVPVPPQLPGAGGLCTRPEGQRARTNLPGCPGPPRPQCPISVHFFGRLQGGGGRAGWEGWDRREKEVCIARGDRLLLQGCR